MTFPLTREEAQRQIAELQRHIDSLPKNNHPPKIEKGMLFRHKDGDLHIIAMVDPRQLKLVNIKEGNRYDDDSLFYTDLDDFEYLGHSKDLLTLKTDKPEVVVTDEMANKAWTSFRLHDGVGRESLRHALTLALNGKL